MGYTVYAVWVSIHIQVGCIVVYTLTLHAVYILDTMHSSIYRYYTIACVQHTMTTCWHIAIYRHILVVHRSCI